MNIQHMLLRYNSCSSSAQNSSLLTLLAVVEASVPTVSAKIQLVTPSFHCSDISFVF